MLLYVGKEEQYVRSAHGNHPHAHAGQAAQSRFPVQSEESFPRQVGLPHRKGPYQESRIARTRLCGSRLLLLPPRPACRRAVCVDRSEGEGSGVRASELRGVRPGNHCTVDASHWTLMGSAVGRRSVSLPGESGGGAVAQRSNELQRGCSYAILACCRCHDRRHDPGPAGGGESGADR